VGADIAVEFKKLKNVDNSTGGNIGFSNLNTANSQRYIHTSCGTPERTIDDDDNWPLFTKSENLHGDVLVIGGANMDRTYRITEDKVQVS
jgi:hypothetical protein